MAKKKKTVFKKVYKEGQKSGRSKDQARHVALAASRALTSGEHGVEREFGGEKADIKAVVKALERTGGRKKKGKKYKEGGKVEASSGSNNSYGWPTKDARGRK